MTVRRAASSAQRSGLVITIRAKPRSAVSTLECDRHGTWTARLTSPPVDGKANAELIGLVARHFGCAKSAVSVLAGASARIKRVRIAVVGTDDPAPSGR